AKQGINCRICRTWLKKGERKANQFLCCNKDSRILTNCQKRHYQLKRVAVADAKPVPDYGSMICDQCGLRQKKQDPMQKRCVSNVKGERSECQKKGMRVNSAKLYDPEPTPEEKTKRMCLKCGEPFESAHVHNRICEDCNILNERARKENKIFLM
ncbi:hypothetical protein KAR10_09330, partial [bacterium]|nr:hypothetical protein [bacterium]